MSSSEIFHVSSFVHVHFSIKMHLQVIDSYTKCLDDALEHDSEKSSATPSVPQVFITSAYTDTRRFRMKSSWKTWRDASSSF